MRQPSFVPICISDMQEEMRREISSLVLPAVMASGVLLIWVTEAAHWAWYVALVGLILLVMPLLALLTLPRSCLTGIWLAVLGCLSGNLLLVYWFPTGASHLLLALPTGLAALLISPGGGFLLAALSSAVIVSGAGLFAPAHGEMRLAALTVVWGVEVLMWVSSRYNGQALGYLWSSYTSMQQLLEEARDQRLELKQTQEDLVLANAQLARLSERLEAMYHVAEDARRAKEQFVANVSHELRTPLNMIIGYSEMITQAPDMYGGELPPSLLADITVIRRNSEHLAALVNDVLDLSQMDAGQMALSREWVSMREIVEAAALAVRPLFEAKGLTLQLSVQDGLPLVLCDRTRIRQVVLNLLSNAGRFTEKGGARIEVQRAGGELLVTVADTGPGIAPEQRGRIFEPFQQADGSIRRRYGGTGLGLSISKRFIELHGGQMSLKSALGEGTTFSFSLPTEDAPALNLGDVRRWFSPDHVYEPRTRRSKAPVPKLVPRFIIVEAGNTLRRLLGRHLVEAEIVGVRDLEQAMAELRKSPAEALIVNDPALAGAGGVADWATDVPYGTPVIGCWLPGEQEAAEDLGVVRYLVKPVAREVLLASLDELPGPIRTALVVDDQPDVLQLISRMLASAGRGYRVLRAPGGERALSLLRERQIDVMLLDMVMPGMDGRRLLSEKGRDPTIRHIPVVAVTAQDPLGQPLVGRLVTLAKGGGLTLRDLVTYIRMTSGATAAPLPPRGQAP